MKYLRLCWRAFLFGMVLFVAGQGLARAAASDWAGDQRGEVRLVTGSDYVNGSVLRAGLEFRYPPGWHGYWRTPGDAGIAPVLDWSGSSNLHSASVAWPAPTRLVVSGLQNSIYTGHFILPLTLELDRANVPVRLALSLDYASCSNVCVPEHANLSIQLRAGPQNVSTEDAGIESALSRVPGTPRSAGIQVLKMEMVRTAGHSVLMVRLRSEDTPFVAPDLFVEGAGSGLPPAPTVRLSDRNHDARLTVALPAPDVSRGHEPLILTVVDGPRAAEFRGPAIGAVSPKPARHDFAVILLLALCGGLVLNLMPCVLPVLSLKAFSLIRDADAGHGAVRWGAAASAFGIMTSFMILAVALSALKLVGATLGWGIQFQQPWFLAGMAAITTIFAANFFDWFSIALPQVLTGAASTPARGPLAEAFLGGMLATLLATPCSAPFVGTAVGFALARSPLEIFAVFFCLGIGMALPFLLLVFAPRLSACLPRPGQWMAKLRVGLGILLLGTAVWLLASLGTVAGVRVAVVSGALLALLLGLLAGAGRIRRIAGRNGLRISAMSLAIASVVVATVGGAGVPARAQDSAGWQAFNPADIASQVAQGQTVFVDVSASWCLTCKVNELTTLDSPAVRRRLTQPGTIHMRADWSHADPVIAAYIQRFGRFGIPLDVVYGPRYPEGKLLPEILDPASVIRVLDDAGGRE